MKLSEALKKLRRECRRLQNDQGRIARRNARRAVVGALRSVRRALDKQFPAIAKAKPEVETGPKPPRPRKLKLPYPRSWDIDNAKLFVAVACDTLSIDIMVQVLAREGASIATPLYLNGRGTQANIMFRPDWRPSQKWMQVIRGLARLSPRPTPMWEAETRAMLDLWEKFWKQPLPLSDLELAARHAEWLEGRKRG